MTGGLLNKHGIILARCRHCGGANLWIEDGDISCMLCGRAVEPPRRAVSNQRIHDISFHLLPQELDRLDEIAEACDLSIAEIVRIWLRDVADDTPIDPGYIEANWSPDVRSVKVACTRDEYERWTVQAGLRGLTTGQLARAVVRQHLALPMAA